MNFVNLIQLSRSPWPATMDLTASSSALASFFAFSKAAAAESACD